MTQPSRVVSLIDQTRCRVLEGEQHSLPALHVLEPMQDVYGGSCFSQNGSSMLPVVLYVVLVTKPFCCCCCFALLPLS